ncbi:unnamed protein product [Clavelina lepadiformis]|uniref:Uncharacterized protein n=1 Tax=Clavelina lepadiformis TaxID=159417 RepID=A0ABP0G1L0_CLALP
MLNQSGNYFSMEYCVNQKHMKVVYVKLIQVVMLHQVESDSDGNITETSNLDFENGQVQTQTINLNHRSAPKSTVADEDDSNDVW